MRAAFGRMPDAERRGPAAARRAAADHARTAPSLADYALGLTSLGFACLPLSSGGRHLDFAAMGLDPLHLRSLRRDMKEMAFVSIAFGMAQRPPGPSAMRRWFGGHTGNIGIVGGAHDLLVLDFDRVPVFERWREANARLFAATPVEQSPNGYHVYLRCRTPRVSSSLHIGVHRAGHIKALGGYVVSSPSTLADGSTYSWLPHQSPLEMEVQEVDDVESLNLHAASPLKRWYRRFRGRELFEPD